MLKVDHYTRHALFGVEATRQHEQTALSNHAPCELMKRAGLALAKLALAVAPHAQCIWIACGSGNNGGDGLEAAAYLKGWGKYVVVTWVGILEHASNDSLNSYQRANKAGVIFSVTPPEKFDLCIDALLGISANPQAPKQLMAEWITLMNASAAPIIAADLPTGLNADTGVLQNPSVNATHTLSFLTLKPGLFTASGRDATGVVWFDNLGVNTAESVNATEPTAWLSCEPVCMTRPHASSKGSFGDVAIIGGAKGMTGAALLAASAALKAGAGRVFVGLLDATAVQVDTNQAELMFRTVDALLIMSMTTVCGCGGGSAIGNVLNRILTSPRPLVLDADALNAVAIDKLIYGLLTERGKRFSETVLTPHPLEAARLLGISTQEVQSNRLIAAQQIADDLNCTVVLKGSGTIITAPGQTPFINPTGNAKLATPGTGDVLAGMIGAQIASGKAPFWAACDAVYSHGLAADQWPKNETLTAGLLSKSL
jgi:hydroxyethylthiazole kinase-like uncharacterized protein yjeF